MSILEVTEFAGKAQVLGSVREVVVAGNKLEIRGVNIAEAQSILNYLAIGLKSVIMPGAVAPAAVQPPAPAVAPAPPPPAPPEAAAPPEAKTKGRKKAEPPEPPPAPAADDLPGNLGQNGNGPAPTDNVVPMRAAPPTPPAPTAGGDAELVEKLLLFKRLGDILAELDERGFKTAEQMTTVCERVKASVPVLRAIPSLAERITRALATMRGEVAG